MNFAITALTCPSGMSEAFERRRMDGTPASGFETLKSHVQPRITEWEYNGCLPIVSHASRHSGPTRQETYLEVTPCGNYLSVATKMGCHHCSYQ